MLKLHQQCEPTCIGGAVEGQLHCSGALEHTSASVEVQCALFPQGYLHVQLENNIAP